MFFISSFLFFKMHRSPQCRPVRICWLRLDVAYDITADGHQVDMHHFLPYPCPVQTGGPGAAMVIGSELV